MKYLLDTHIFLWYIESNSRLEKGIDQIIKDPANTIYLSVAAVWELIIKTSLGKFKCDLPIIEFAINHCLLHSIQLIDLTIDDLSGLENLPHFHKDPFDRIMIIQSINRKISFLTDDSIIKKYFS